MDVFGLEARQSDLARGIVIVRCREALDRAEQRAMWHLLAAAGITEDDSDETAADDGEPPLRLLTAPWLPPLAEEIPSQRAGVERANELHAIEAVWFVKVETGIDGEAWQDLRATHLAEQREMAAEEVEQASLPPAEVLYTAPDAPLTSLTMWPTRDPALGEGSLLDPEDLELPESVSSLGASGIVGSAAGLSVPGLGLGVDDSDGDSDADALDDDELDDGDMDDDTPDPADPDSVMELLIAESHWRNGSPPTERSVPFPVESYPEVLDDYDWREFGIVLKLGGTQLGGEDSVINAFFALWLSAYQDERVESFEPFSRADVAHDRPHRSALLWVERFMVPATPSDQVHFLLWIIHRLHEVVPVAWSRFDISDESAKVRRDEAGEVELILAGNPLAERARRYGEDEALSWAVAQSGWSKPELAAMLVELALDHDPDVAESAAHAERLLRRALSFDRASDAPTFLVAVLVRHGRTAEAIPFAAAGRPGLRLFLTREVAEHSEPKGDAVQLDQVLPLLDAATMEASEDEELAELAHAIAIYAPVHLAAYLETTPRRVSLLPHLYNASFDVKREQALTLLRRVLTLPEPDKSASEARAAMVMAWNNACIHAHALGEYELARQLADGGMPFAEENPHIFHSAACAYAAIGELPRALASVRNAISHDYEHIEKMETDPDLSPLHADPEFAPQFAAIFAEWRHQRADLN
jgi:hypothetical protein